MSHSFPTRRSSDLAVMAAVSVALTAVAVVAAAVVAVVVAEAATNRFISQVI